MTMTDTVVDLVEEGIDLAITTLPVPDSNLVMRRIGSFRLLLCGAPSYFAKHGKPSEPSDLSGHNCLRYTFSNWGSDWRFRSPQGSRAVHVTGNMETNSINALKLAAELGQGLILVPDYLIMSELKSGALIAVLTEFSCPNRPINAIYPHRHHLSANVRSFLDLVAQRFHDAEKDIAPPEPEQRQVLPALVPSNRAPAPGRLDA
jgi:DNA-binding transcriptional LysR family regulator